MDKISFNGITNIKIMGKSYEQCGFYFPDSANNIASKSNKILEYGKKRYKELHICCDLTDDANGNDFSFFKEKLKNSKKHYELNCIDSNNPHHVDLYMKRFDVRDKYGRTSNSEFKINKCSILLSDKNVLPLYTFMAKVTRKIENMTNLSEMRRKCAQLFNLSVQKEAVQFIEM